MGIFSTARAGALPSSLVTRLSLAEIRDAIASAPPSLARLAPGWSGPVQDSRLGMRNTQPPVAQPVILAATAEYPERLHARFYYFDFPAIFQDVYSQGSEQERSQIAAIDVWITADAARSSAYTMIWSTRNTPEADKPFKSLLALIRAVDPVATASLNGGPFYFNEPDVFLWLLVRARENPALDAGVELVRIDAVSGTDHSARVTSLSRGVDFNRPAFLVAVAEAEQLGPVWVRFKVAAEKSRMGYQSRSDGSVAPVAIATHYHKVVDSGETHERAIADYYFRLLPLVLKLYSEDVQWKSVTRAAEIRAAAVALIERYQPFTADLEREISEPVVEEPEGE